MNSRVFYECWQMQCCGDPFKLGDTVKWPVCKPTGALITPVDVGQIDYWYEAHDTESELYNFTGTVTAVKGLFERYEPSEDNPKLMTPVYGELFKLASVDGWEKDINDLEISGYVVELENCSIEPIKKKSPT